MVHFDVMVTLKKEEMPFVKVIIQTVFWIKRTPIALFINDLSLHYEFFNQGIAKRVWYEKLPLPQNHCFKTRRLLELMEGPCLIRQERKLIVFVRDGEIEIAHILNVIHTHLLHNALILLSGFLQRMIRKGDSESDGGRCSWPARPN